MGFNVKSTHLGHVGDNFTAQMTQPAVSQQTRDVGNWMIKTAQNAMARVAVMMNDEDKDEQNN